MTRKPKPGDLIRVRLYPNYDVLTTGLIILIDEKMGQKWYNILAGDGKIKYVPITATATYKEVKDKLDQTKYKHKIETKYKYKIEVISES